MSKLHLNCANCKPEEKQSKQPETTPCKHCPIEPDLETARTCKCEATARALSDDVPRFLGLKNIRDTVLRDQENEIVLSPSVLKQHKDSKKTKDLKETKELKNPKEPKAPKEPKDPKFCKHP
nr:uncharacterized protein LOC110383241 [Helicoverpa armigera]